MADSNPEIAEINRQIGEHLDAVKGLISTGFSILDTRVNGVEIRVTKILNLLPSGSEPVAV